MRTLTPLEQAVYDWLTSDDDAQGMYDDLQQGGYAVAEVGVNAVNVLQGFDDHKG